jgi:type IV secretory pathway VirB2 component (pilin)
MQVQPRFGPVLKTAATGKLFQQGSKQKGADSEVNGSGSSKNRCIEFFCLISRHIVTAKWLKPLADALRDNSFRCRCITVASAILIMNTVGFAQSDPWTASANNLKTAFTGPLATALIAVAVVVTGMVFAFSEGQGKRQLAGLTFGGAMALGAVRFMAWLFT